VLNSIELNIYYEIVLTGYKKNKKKLKNHVVDKYEIKNSTLCAKLANNNRFKKFYQQNLCRPHFCDKRNLLADPKLTLYNHSLPVT